MSRPSPYFMHDQARHRVERIMRAREPTAAAGLPLWPLIAVIAALTVINVLSTIPQP